MKKEDVRIKVDDMVIVFDECGNATWAPLKHGWDVDLADLNDKWFKVLNPHEEEVWRYAIYILHVHNKGNTCMLFLEVQEWTKCEEFETVCLEPIIVVISNPDHCEVTIIKDSYPFQS